MWQSRSLSMYGWAAALSLLIHLSFFVVVDRAMAFFEQALPVNAQTSIFFVAPRISSISAEPIELPRAPVPDLKQAEKYLTDASPLGLLEEHKQWDAVRRFFEATQAHLDHRIDRLKSHLDALSAPLAEADLAESITLEISDFEKVPRDLREKLLPDYFKRMRSKIAKIWIQGVLSEEIRSGRTTIQYRIMPSGHLTHLAALEADGTDAFRRVCLLAVQKASPLDPLPFEIAAEKENRFLTIRLTFYLRAGKG